MATTSQGIPLFDDTTPVAPLQALLNAQSTALDAALVSGSPTGAVVQFAGATAPSGWLLCNGQTVSRATYPNLFNVIGTTYNTSGESTSDFRLPNLKGRVVVGVDSGQTEFNALGKSGGTKEHQLTVAQLPAHNHTIVRGAASGNVTQAVTQTSAGDGSVANRWHLADGTAGLNTKNTGSGEAHPNLQPYVVMNYIIKAL